MADDTTPIDRDRWEADAVDERVANARPEQGDVEGRRLRSAVLAQMFEHPEPLRIGRFAILSRAGEGGFGVVYAAYDPELDRRVALKLLRAASGDSKGTSGRARLLREAQAVAGLNHPHVVTIYDVGTFEDQVYIAMELVDGTTLGQWLREQPRPWRQVVRTFVAAGRGLAAAHAAGVIHRDFKPGNVLVGRDGRIRVTDFGLARRVRDDDPVSGEPRAPSASPDGATREGTVMGTPAYMAPEQHAGQTAGAPADQFAFAVALHEGLFGRRPFEGADARELARNKQAGRMVSPPADHRVPMTVRRIVSRGLAAAPSDRWPDLPAMLDALDAESNRSGLRLLAGAGVITALTLGAIAVSTRRGEALCSPEPPPTAVTWELQRAGIESAFAATGLGFADDALARTLAGIEAWFEQWRDVRVQACEATQTGQQGADAFFLQQQCLDDADRRLAALVAAFAAADEAIIEAAVDAVSKLPPPRACLHAQARRGPPPPEDPTVAAEVERIRIGLLATQSLEDVGRLQPAAEQAARLLADARATDYPPIVAAAAYWLGRLEGKLARESAEANLREALQLAIVGGDEATAILAASNLAFVIGYQERRVGEGRIYGEHALALARHAGLAGVAWAAVLSDVAAVHNAAGDRAMQEQLTAEVLEIRMRELGEHHLLTAAAVANLGEARLLRGDPRGARELLERAVEVRRAALGPRHPGVVAALMTLGRALLELGELDEARARLLEAEAIATQAWGADHPMLARVLTNLMVGDRRAKRFAEAEARGLQALAIFERHAAPDLGRVANNLGLLYIDMGRFDEAERALRRALEVDARSVSALLNLGMLERRRGRGAAARPHYQQALALLAGQAEPPPLQRADAEQGLGMLELELGNLAAATGRLESALQLRREHGSPAAAIAELELGLARSLAPREPDRARTLAEAARARVADDAALRGEIAAFLATL